MLDCCVWFVAGYLVVGLIVVWIDAFGFVVVGVCCDLLGCCMGIWCGWRVLCSAVDCLVLVLLGPRAVAGFGWFYCVLFGYSSTV